MGHIPLATRQLHAWPVGATWPPPTSYPSPDIPEHGGPFAMIRTFSRWRPRNLAPLGERNLFLTLAMVLYAHRRDDTEDEAKASVSQGCPVITQVHP